MIGVLCVVQRFGNLAGVFSVMACAVRAMDQKNVEPTYMTKLAKIATAEIVTSKVWKPQLERKGALLGFLFFFLS